MLLIVRTQANIIAIPTVLHARAKHTRAYNFELPDSMIYLMIEQYLFNRYPANVPDPFFIKFTGPYRRQLTLVLLTALDSTRYYVTSTK